MASSMKQRGIRPRTERIEPSGMPAGEGVSWCRPPSRVREGPDRLLPETEEVLSALRRSRDGAPFLRRSTVLG